MGTADRARIKRVRQVVDRHGAQVGHPHVGADSQEDSQHEADDKHGEAADGTRAPLGTLAAQGQALVQFLVAIGTRVPATFLVSFGEAGDNLLTRHTPRNARRSPTRRNIGTRGQVVLGAPVIVPVEGCRGLITVGVFPLGGGLLAWRKVSLLGREAAQRRRGRGDLWRGGRARLRVGGGGGHDRRGVFVLRCGCDDRRGLGRRR